MIIAEGKIKVDFVDFNDAKNAINDWWGFFIAPKKRKKNDNLKFISFSYGSFWGWSSDDKPKSIEYTISEEVPYIVITAKLIDRINEEIPLPLYLIITSSNQGTIPQQTFIINKSHWDEYLTNILKDIQERLEENRNKKKYKRKIIKRINKLLLVERIEEAAILYESIGMLEEAGKVRRKQRIIISKSFLININTLYDQIKTNGLIIPYKYTNCSGTLKITGNKKYQVCPYCDSDLDIDTLSDFIKALL